MKKLLLSLTIFGAMFSANAGVITVSNNPNSPGQYTDLQLAIDDATSGDTLLVAGSATTYGSGTIDSKELHIVGIGYEPNKQVPYSTSINTLTIAAGASLSANGTTVQGISVGTINFGGQLNNQLNDIAVFRCNVNGSISIGSHVSGVLVYNNRINNVSLGSGSTVSSITVQNNIIIGAYSRGGNNSNGNVTVRNNIFIKNFGVSLNQSCANTLFANNIFYGTSGFNSIHEHCTFNNNISYNTTNDNFNITGTNSGGGNIVGQDPEFIIESNFLFDVDDDFNVATSSPIINAGTDGTDLGIYGGSYPWPEGGASGSGYMYSQEPQFPQVNEMNIQNAVLPNTQMLDVQVKGITND